MERLPDLYLSGIAAIRSRSEFGTVCNMTNKGRAGGFTGLFLAAPAMLAALEQGASDLEFLLRAIDAGDPVPELRVRVKDMIASHRAAIAQAKGELE